MNEIKDYTKLFKEGDIVYHFKLGKCEVARISDDETQPMCIKYNHKPSGDECYMHIDKDVISSLSFAPYDFDNLDQFTRVRPIKENTPVFVRELKQYHWKLRRTAKDCLSHKNGKIAVYSQQYPSQCVGRIVYFNHWTFDIPDLLKE